MDRSKPLALHCLVLALLAGCSTGEPRRDASGASQVGKPATISHIHGLGVDSAGTLFVATHHGLLKRGSDASFVYASNDTNDHMGFSLHPDDRVMYRSGHSFDKPALGVESSTDGSSWEHLSDVADPPVDFHAMTVSFADSKLLWGWDSGGRGTFRSTDGGRTWRTLQTQGIERQIYVLAGPPTEQTVLAGTATGLYRSTDGGATWRAVRGFGDGWVIGIAADPKDVKHLLVSTQRGMKVSRDGGETWEPAGQGLPKDAELAHLAIAPTDGKRAYAADSATIYETVDGGARWAAIVG